MALGHLGLVAALEGRRWRLHLAAGGLQEGIGVEGVLRGGVHELAGAVELIQLVFGQIQELHRLTVGSQELLRCREI